MATSREERMQQRMRGAQRHQVQDASFDFFLPTTEPEPADDDDTTVTDASSSPKRRRLSKEDDGSHGGPGDGREPVPAVSTPRGPSGTATTTSTSAPAVPLILQGRDEELEIDESPADAPGSGKRRRRVPVAVSPAAGRTAALQQAVTAGKRSPLAFLLPGARKDMVPSSPLSSKRTVRPRESDAERPHGDSGDLSADELSPELATAPIVPQPLPGRRSNSMFAKLANAKRLSAEAEADGSQAMDELSPMFMGVSDPISTVGAHMPPSSSSPLARKSAAHALAARTGRQQQQQQQQQQRSLAVRRRQRSSTLSSTRSRRGTATDAAEKESEPEPEQEKEQPEASHDKRQPLDAIVLPSSQSSQTRRTAEVPSSSPPLQSGKRKRGRPQSSPVVETIAEDVVAESVEVELEDAAEEIDEEEAARALGRKRPRRPAVHEASPDLGSGSKDAASLDTEASAADARKAKKPRRKPGSNSKGPSKPRPTRTAFQDKAAAATANTTVESPAQPRQRTRAEAGDEPDKDASPAGDDENDDENGNDERNEEQGESGSGSGGKAASTRKKKKPKETQQARKTRGSTGDKGPQLPPVPIVVQRFSRPGRKSKTPAAEDGGDPAKIKDDGSAYFAGRSGVNAIDVLAQVCEDVVEQKLQEATAQAAEAKEAAAAETRETSEAGEALAAARSARRDALARRHALETFLAELRTRLLAQAAALDAAHSLRRRVRTVHKEKLALRDEILRIRAEREQVALRMDALRVRHQAASQKAMTVTNMSATIHDIDLAVEQGRAAPDLTPAQQKTAELGNLELVVSRVTDQLCGGGGGGSGRGSGSGGPEGGGTLKQVRDFNAFLERAAAVLEGRRPFPKPMAAQ